MCTKCKIYKLHTHSQTCIERDTPVFLGSGCPPLCLSVNKSAKALRGEYFNCSTAATINLSVFAEPEKEDKCYQIAGKVLGGLLLSLTFAHLRHITPLRTADI